MSRGLRHVERPAAGDPADALVFFHGYAGLPEDFVALLDKIEPERRFHGYLPQGPHGVGDGRTSWFPRESGEPPETQLAAVADWLDALPYPPDQTVLGGWSQGANVAYTLALGAGRPRPSGLLALGGGFRNGPPAELEPPLPRVAIAHGTADDAVSVDVARQARDLLERAGATVLYLETNVRHRIQHA